MTMPAPSRPRLPPVDPDRPVRTERPDRDTRLDTDAECPVSRAVVAIAETDAGALPHTSQYPSTIVPVQPGSAHLSEDELALGAAAAGAADGAVPQVSQYPSSMVPVQPGSVQFMIASPISAR
ncbi:hypothetical protein [Nocardia terrae]